MNTTTAIVGAGATVVAGKWANGEHLTINIAIGIGVGAIALALLSSANERLAGLFAWAILFGALLKYLPAIVAKLGWTGASGTGGAPS
jgi:hypothetical protein